MNTKLELTPAQRVAADGVVSAISRASFVVLRSGPAKGRTTILRAVHAAVGGALAGVTDFLQALVVRQPAAMEEAFHDVIESCLANHDLVIVDDFHLMRNIFERYDYQRQPLLDVILTAVLDKAEATNKRIILGVEHDGAVPSVDSRAVVWQVGDFTASDYEVICRHRLPSAVSERLDYSRIHRFAPMLNLWQLRNACTALCVSEKVDTDKFVEYLSAHNLISNVHIEQVRTVELKDIKGVDDVIHALEAKIALPFENPVLAAELDLKPRRGVLLAGPPGTGKTTIGRALAHRLKSKFFLIDGTAISGTGDFYQSVNRVFDAAKRNAPSVIFIDDADVIFENGGDRGLYRYLLTMLDGLESASAERVCIMMTAMDPASLPPALLRSGRVELWLETRLPDAEARESIFRESLSKLPNPICTSDSVSLAAASHGLTGADLRAVVEEGKLLFAHDKANGKPLRPIEEYFLEAIETVRENRRSYTKRRPAPFREVSRIGFETSA